MAKLRTALILILLLMPVSVLAQSGPESKSLEIAIWPEYDRPAALVIYQLRLADDIPLPAVVSLPIPAAVGDPHAVAAWHPDGALEDALAWRATRQGEVTMVEVTTQASGVWLEFYDDMTMDGDLRSYQYTWTGGLAADSMSIEVLHPIGAEDLKTTPSGAVEQRGDGLRYSVIDIGSGTAVQPFSIELSYSKPATIGGGLAARQQNPGLSSLEVGLWPEYDQPAMLVLYRGTLAPEAALPATLSLPIPGSAGEPNAVAFLGSDNRLYTADFEIEADGSWSWVTFVTESRAFQVEYYDDLVFDGSTRNFSFNWPGGLEIGALSYSVQQPIGVNAVTVTPGGVVQPDANGLVYVRGGLGPQGLESSLTINLQYDKSSDELTADALASAPSIDRPSTTLGSTPDLMAILPYVLAAFGFLLIGFGVYLGLRRLSQAKNSPKRPRQRKRSSKQQSTGSDLDAAAVFCHVCGTKATASDHFCRGCGTKLRT